MRILGDNSDGFKNEINIEKCLDFKLFESINPNLQHFLQDVFKGYSLKGKRVHAIRCRVRVKPDFYLHIDDIPKEVYVSVKKGVGNSVHQESLVSFLKFIKSLGASNNVLDDIKYYHYGDETTDNTGKFRYTAREFSKSHPEIVKRLNEYFAQEKVQNECIQRFVFKGNIDDAPEAEYIYHGTAYSGVWASKKEIYDYISGLRKDEHVSSVNIGPLSYQVWNRNLKFSSNAENKREQMQVKWSSLEEMLTTITSQRKAYKQRGTEEGTLDEITSVVFFNRNPEHTTFLQYLSSIKTVPNKTLMVRVTTKQYSTISEQKVMTRADAYAIKVIDDRIYDILEENEFYLDETILVNCQKYFEFIPQSGISIKMQGSCSYQLLKLTPKSFNKLFGSYELGAVASLFCQNEEDLFQNLALINGWQTNIDKIKENFPIFNISESLLVSSVELCKQLKKYAVDLIRENIDYYPELQRKIFNGIGVYQEPYSAYFFMQNNVIKALKYIEYVITTGSGRSHGDYTIVLKPR